VHKLGIVLKELNETEIWLEIIKRSELLSLEKVQPVAQENKEMCRIIGESIRTTREDKQLETFDLINHS